MRPHAYLIVAAGRPLHAPTLEELTEIVELRVPGWRLDRLAARVHAGGRWRLLSCEELGRFAARLTSRLG